ncbi:MAG: hypothetical protein ACREL1_06300 [bacterium]
MSSRVSLAVGTAAFGGQVTQLYGASVLSLERACFDRKIEFHYMTQSGDALVQRARQQLTASFLAIPDATHLLMVDADIGFEPEQVFRLLDFDRDFTAAAYPRKNLDLVRLKELFGKDHPDPESAALVYEFEPVRPVRMEKEFFQAETVGAGFLLLKKEAIVSMTEAYPELSYSGGFIAADPLAQSPHRSALFNCMKDEKTGTYLSEDASFCRRWTSRGGEIWVDGKSRLKHVGARVFNGDLSVL